MSAVFGAAIENIYYFVALRLCATGIGWGITNTAALAILADLFTDEDEHGKFVGWYNSAMSIIGAIMAAVAGVLAVTAWQDAFYTYVIWIPVLIMLIAFLPAFPAKKNDKADADKAAAESAQKVEAGWWKPLIPLTIQVFFVANLLLRHALHDRPVRCRLWRG